MVVGGELVVVGGFVVLVVCDLGDLGDFDVVASCRLGWVVCRRAELPLVTTSAPYRLDGTDAGR
jgi:hypothetical protein